MTLRPIVSPLLGLLLLTTSGCASLLDYRRSDVAISVEPAQAPVTIDVDGVSNGEHHSLVGPSSTAFLSRDSDYRIRFTSPGYQANEVTLGRKLHPYFWLDAAFLIPAIAFAGVYLLAPNNGGALGLGQLLLGASAIGVPLSVVSFSVDAISGNMWTHAQNNVTAHLLKTP